MCDYGRNTQQLIFEMQRLAADETDIDYNYDDLISFINSNAFPNFSERLQRFYNETEGHIYTEIEAQRDLTSKAKKAGIILNKGTVKNWFTSGNYPKYGKDYRDNIFKIAFALNLSVDGTKRLFNKVYLDKAFNIRNIHDFVYLCCLNNGMDFSAAEDIINRVENSICDNSITEQFLETKIMDDDVLNLSKDSDIIYYITTNKINFTNESRTAERYLNSYIHELTGSESKYGLAQREAEKFQSFTAKKSLHSLDFLLYMLFDKEPVKKDSSLDNIKAIFCRKEITNQFPDKRNFSSNENSSYIIRKQIILVFFYWYWVNDVLRTDKISGTYDEFHTQLDNILFECGMSPLYPSNPYDWLFLFCSQKKEYDEYPMDIFRSIIGSNIK